MDYKITMIGLDELKQALARNPRMVRNETGKFLVRAMAVYTRLIINNPWRMGMSGGGVPVGTGNLRDSHFKIIMPWEAFIQPTAPYAGYVHGDDGKLINSKGKPLRPWLDYAKDKGQKDVEKLEIDMVENIVQDLSK
jgi:hypothetical protein